MSSFSLWRMCMSVQCCHDRLSDLIHFLCCVFAVMLTQLTADWMNRFPWPRTHHTLCVYVCVSVLECVCIPLCLCVHFFQGVWVGVCVLSGQSCAESQYILCIQCVCVCVRLPPAGSHVCNDVFISVCLTFVKYYGSKSMFLSLTQLSSVSAWTSEDICRFFCSFFHRFSHCRKLYCMLLSLTVGAWHVGKVTSVCALLSMTENSLGNDFRKVTEKY